MTHRWTVVLSCAWLWAAAGCGGPTAADGGAPPARPAVDAAAPGPVPTTVAHAPGALFAHGEQTYLFAEPLPGRALRLLFGGPPFRLCEVDDLAAAHPEARCTDLAVPAGAENVELVSLDPGVTPRFITGRSLAAGPLLDAAGTVRVAATVRDFHVAADGVVAGLDVTDARGWELVRFREGQPEARLGLRPGRDGLPLLLGDRALFASGGHLRARRVLSGAAPAFGPEEDLGPAPAWRTALRCRAPGGDTVGVLVGELQRMVPNAGMVDEPGPATVVFAGPQAVRTTPATLPARPHVVACAGDAVTMLWAVTSRRPAERRRRHALTRVRCTPAGCVTTTATAEGFEAWNPPVAALGDEVLLVRTEGHEVRLRLGPLDGLGGAPERILVTGPAEPTWIELLPRGDHVAVVVDFPGETRLLSVARDGAVTPIAPERVLPPLPSGVFRAGAR